MCDDQHPTLQIITTTTRLYSQRTKKTHANTQQYCKFNNILYILKSNEIFISFDAKSEIIMYDCVCRDIYIYISTYIMLKIKRKSKKKFQN